MKAIKLTLVSFLLFGCEFPPSNTYDMTILNNSNVDVYCYKAQVGPIKNTYPDTTLFFIKSDDCTIQGFSLIKSKTSNHTGSHDKIEDIIADIPSDTCSFFFIQADIFDHYSCEDIKANYRILVRYDLSLSNLKVLSPKDGYTIIPYPPTEQMKDMKMYPPYEQVIKSSK